MDGEVFKLHYKGSWFWLIFWLVIFFPVAFVLLLTASNFRYKQKTYTVLYTGSRFWLCFWLIFFFPIAFVLIFVNGLSIRTSEKDGFERSRQLKGPIEK